MHYDVFNGDADGMMALVQLRLDEPRESVLVTGVKRDIQLLQKVASQKDVTSATVLDVSMEKNKESLLALLKRGVEVFYCDHHRDIDLPSSKKLTTLIDLDPQICTGLLINTYLEGKYATWAVAAAFGDNLHNSAHVLAQANNISPMDTDFLKKLGMLVNYNAYGVSLDDLHLSPKDLYGLLLKYRHPFALRDDRNSPFYILNEGYEEDYANVVQLQATHDTATYRVYELPCAPWARRISGVLSNELTYEAPNKANAVLTLNKSGKDYTVSLRSPVNNREGADEICASFPTGGGRKAAAGINSLPIERKQDFIAKIEQRYH